MKKLALILSSLTVVLWAGSALAESKACILTITVMRDVNGKQKPARSAAVILHGVDKAGRQQHSGSEIKTDSDGHTSYPGVPYGRLRIQVILPGYQTFGQDYEIRQPEQTIEVHLKRPAAQYSIYGDDKGQPPEKKEPSPTAKTPPAPPPK